VRLLSSGSPEVEALNKVLWPEHREFRVTMVVDGARRLEHLEQLLVGARQSPRTGAIEGIREVQTLTAEAVVSSPNQVTGSGAFVELRVQAVDAYAAISLARRQLSETLDQYAAGQRLLDFSIGPRSLAEDLIDGVRTQGDPLTASAKIAQPLTAHWPQALRPALRSAHLASRAEAPMTSAALAWSAIDSTGIKSDELGLLAKSCALQTTRQQVLGLYQTLADAVTVRLAGARWEVREYSRTLAKDERAIERTRGHQANAAQERHVLLTVLAEGKREHLIDLQTRLSQLQDDMLLPCATVRRNLLVSPIGDEPFNLSGFLEPNAWLDALLPPTGMASAQLLESQSAIGELGRIAGGLAQESLIVWRRRLSDPPALNAWLNCQESTFKELLEWLYVTRNSAFHSGQFVGPADELTAHAARGTVDLILEFLGNWHRAERPHNPTGTPVMDIFRELAKRNVDLRMALKSASSCHPLNIDTITGYGSDCWNRSLP
jgi:hypothetical protein